MRRRQFVLGSASAFALPLVGPAGCGGSSSNGPVPIPPSQAAVHLPADQYLHRGAPTEWWWHMGTLRSGDRVFGFEINAASFTTIAFTQLMVTDVKNARHLQRTTFYVPPFGVDINGWAEHDPTKDWFAALGSPANVFSAITVTNPGSGYTSDPTVEIIGGGGVLASAVAVREGDRVSQVLLVGPGIGYTSLPIIRITGGGGSGATAVAFHSYATMSAPWGDPTQNMAVKARLVDDPTLAVVDFDLNFSQKGPPFIVFGTGVTPVPGTSGGHLQTNNYYYSLTKLQATGTLTIDGERFAVTGSTWMDHEYGAFSTPDGPVKWILQDMQLDNGVSISNYSILGVTLPALNERRESNATVMLADGRTYYEPSFVTPVTRTWKSERTGRVYFMELFVEIPSFGASFLVKSLVDSQEFALPDSPVYEGVSTVTGTFEGASVSGTAWNEQALK